MSYFQIVSGQIAIFVVYSLIGVIAVRCGVVDRQGLTFLSRLITRVLLPLLIFTNTINGTTREDFLSSLVILGIAIILYALLYGAAAVLARVFHVGGRQRGVYAASFMFGNIGFMGIPIVVSLFAERGALYVATFQVLDQMMLWTVGTRVLTPPDYLARQGSVLQTVRRILNPALVGIVLGVIVMLSGLRLPEFVNTALTKTGGASTPLAMFYLGGMFCYIHVRDYIRRPEIYALTAVKMLALPIATAAVLHQIPAVPTEIAVTMSVITGLPPMASVAMIAESQGSDSDYASGLVFMTTLLAVVTLPFVCVFI